MEYLLAAFFLPLFPLSIGFNALYARIDNVGLRIVLMLTWPVAGIYIVLWLGGNPPMWIVYWAALTALLYAFRSLVIRELNLWTAYVASSVWAMLWVTFITGLSVYTQWQVMVVLALPLVLMPWISSCIKLRYGGVYAGAVSGMAENLPRLSSLLVIIILATVATPLFPGFFTLLGMVNHLLPVLPLVSLGILLVWLLWTWSGIRILQGLVVGPAGEQHKTDINLVMLTSVLVLLAAYVAAGLNISGVLL